MGESEFERVPCSRTWPFLQFWTASFFTPREATSEGRLAPICSVHWGIVFWASERRGALTGEARSKFALLQGFPRVPWELCHTQQLKLNCLAVLWVRLGCGLSQAPGSQSLPGKRWTEGRGGNSLSQSSLAPSSAISDYCRSCPSHGLLSSKAESLDFKAHLFCEPDCCWVI